MSFMHQSEYGNLRLHSDTGREKRGAEPVIDIETLRTGSTLFRIEAAVLLEYQPARFNAEKTQLGIVGMAGEHQVYISLSENFRPPVRRIM